MVSHTKKIVIIGGGITGLTTAYYLQKQKDVEITIVEASHKLGGKIRTEYKDGFVIERGPDSFLERKTSASELAHDLGIEHQLVRNEVGLAYVLVNDQLHPMPAGAVMGIPTQLQSFLKTNLFSVQGKLRAGFDLVLPRSHASGDQSLGLFFRRRLGDEVVENLVEPLLSGIYAGDIDQLSLMSTFPQFSKVEKEHRSLILGMKKTTQEAKKTQLQAKTQGKFLTLNGGLQQFVDALEEQLEDVNIVKGIRVVTLDQQASGAYELQLSNGQMLEADQVVLTVPHFTLTNLLPEEITAAEKFRHIPSTSVANVAMAFDEADINNELNGTGFVVSRNSNYTITACTWTHKKWPHTTPDGKVLLRCYVGRAGDETVVDLSDDEIEKIVLADLKETMGIEAKPQFTIITRLHQAMPQYLVGHQEKVSELKKQLKEHLPGVHIAGMSYDGIGLPDCIKQGMEVAKTILSQE